MTFKRSIFHGAFAADVPTSQSDILAASQRPLTLSAASAPSGAPGWKTGLPDTQLHFRWETAYAYWIISPIANTTI